MELKELEYQVDAIEAVTNVFKDIPITRINSKTNPVFDFNDEYTLEKIRTNITTSQTKNEIATKFRTSVEDGILGIDVKMETGTGKTYVYSRLMLELHAQYKFNKFIIITPTTPIKEGTKAFLSSEMFKRHFSLYPDYSNDEISFEVLDATKGNKKGRRYFPLEVRNFSEGDSYAENTINVFLTGMAMMKQGKTQTLDRSDYDETLFSGTTRPIEALGETRPIVILDEAHRFSRDQKTYKYICSNLNPLAIIRFGATFPNRSDGTEDYNNLVYNLTSAQAFNKDLIKGVSVFNPEIGDISNTRYKLVSISGERAKGSKKVKFRNETTHNEYELSINDSLNIMSEDFSNITIVDIDKFEELNKSNGILLSNDRMLAVGDSLYAGIFSKSYQEMMINQAIDLHFKKEKENFYRSPRYKTLALFFIDRVESYRNENDQPGILRTYFEKQLSIRLKEEIQVIKDKVIPNSRDTEYLDYLKTSLENISMTNGGYFSKDNSTSDEEIKKEVDEILRDKETLLSFKNDNGDWNIRRFIFSKWTLREGWDNPNVFTIAKLRSSGSESSKIQEVGRGLRLPVDEYGNRAEIGQDDFRLNYLIDYTDNDFAESLEAEINKGVAFANNIKGLLAGIAEKLEMKVSQLMGHLMVNGYIDEECNVIEENREQFYIEYPDFRVGVKKDKVRKGNPEEVKIRKENYEKIRDLWEKINQNYMVHFDPIDTQVLEAGIKASMTLTMFHREKSSFAVSKILKSDDGQSVSIEKSKTTTDFYLDGDKLGYGEFLKKLNMRTSLPIGSLHKEISAFHEANPSIEIYPTNRSVDVFVNNFENWFIENFEGKYSYRKLGTAVKETPLTDIDGNPKETITQASIGVFQSEPGNKVPEKFLYDKIIYDSPFEETNIINGETQSVEVYGKIPRKSIRVPMYFGGTTSPDFMYVVNKKDGSHMVNLIIESKDVKRKIDLRGLEGKKINASKKFFEELDKEGINVVYQAQLKDDKIRNILEELTGE